MVSVVTTAGLGMKICYGSLARLLVSQLLKVRNVLTSNLRPEGITRYVQKPALPLFVAPQSEIGPLRLTCSTWTCGGGGKKFRFIPGHTASTPHHPGTKPSDRKRVR